MAFPSSPTNGQTAVVNGVLYTYNSTSDTWTRTSQGMSSADVVFIAGSQTVTGAKTFSGVSTFSGNVVSTDTILANAVSANGTVGTAGQVLTSDGTKSYWATASSSSSPTSATFVSGGAGTTFNNFDSNGTTQIIGTSTGAIVSYDSGSTWSVVQGIVRADKGFLYTGSSWIIVDGTTTKIMRSTDDGVTWTAVYTPAQDTKFIVKAPSGALYAHAQTGAVYYSTNDGATWSAPGTITNMPNPGQIAVSSTIGVGVGNSGAITSFVLPTGAGTVRASGTANSLTSVVWDSTLGLFVAVGQSGTIVTSPNGTTWTVRTSGVTANLNNVKSNGTEYVAVGQSGTIVRSPDGINWTSSQVSLTQFNDVDWTGSKWVAVGSGAIIYEFT